MNERNFLSRRAQVCGSPLCRLSRRAHSAMTCLSEAHDDRWSGYGAQSYAGVTKSAEKRSPATKFTCHPPMPAFWRSLFSVALSALSNVHSGGAVGGKLLGGLGQVFGHGANDGGELNGQWAGLPCLDRDRTDGGRNYGQIHR